MHLPGRMAALRLTPFTPTRRFWSVSWARHEDRIVGLAAASARRGWMLDWQVGWMLRRGQGPPRLRNAEQPVTSGCESRSLAQGPAVTPPGPIIAPYGEERLFDSAGNAQLFSVHVVYCHGCRRRWLDPPPAPHVDCACVCSDPEDPLYETWVVDPG